jgi:hypothetical protein
LSREEFMELQERQRRRRIMQEHPERSVLFCRLQIVLNVSPVVGRVRFWCPSCLSSCPDVDLVELGNIGLFAHVQKSPMFCKLAFCMLHFFWFEL